MVTTARLGGADVAGRAIATRPAGSRRSGRAYRRLSVFVIVLGAGLIAAPFAFQMFQRAPKGASMLTEFKPFMTTARLDGYQHEIAVIGAGVDQVGSSVGPYLQQAAGTASLAGAYPSYGQLASQWPAIDQKMTSLLDKVQGNLGNYRDVAALPSFSLFPWFFVIPGILMLGSGLVLLRRRRTGVVVLVAVVGLGLVLAPVAFQMFSRAPAGGHMMTAFRDIETTANVTEIQDDFSVMASGQGAIRLDIVPALESAGLSQPQIAERFPAVDALDADWIHILNDMTPMIGAMSDNVPNYQAMAALPPFALFPWFFVIPGVLLLGAAGWIGLRLPESTAGAAGATEEEKR